jgi:hypothetical protein
MEGRTPNGVIMMAGWSTPRKDLTLEDAVLTFKNDASRAWTDVEIERVDKAFAILHEATGNTDLLKLKGGGGLTFQRIANHPSDTETSKIGGDNNSNGLIRLTDAGLSGPETGQVGVVLHEIGHNWDNENPHWEEFKQKSGWTRADPNAPVPAGYTRIDRYNEIWWYKTDAKFVSWYAKTHPLDDFAESFAAYFLQKAGRSWSDMRPEDGPGAAAIPDKIAVIETWVKGLQQQSS